MKFSRLLLVLPLLLTACSGGEVRKSLGLDRKAPDEFVVYSRPPLSVPPEFELMPPRPGAENPNTPTTEAQARELLLGTKPKPESLDDVLVQSSVETAVVPVLEADAPTPAQSSFLAKAGASDANDTIRETLRSDMIAVPKKKKKAQSLYEQLVQDDKTEPTVDAKKEAERLRKNKDEGKPVTEGDTPTNDNKPKSLLDRVF